MEVLIDGVAYVPKNEVPELTDDRLKKCLAELTSIQRFPECSNKHRAWAWDAMNAIAPDIAELSSNDPQAAFELFNED
ncbi:hypothetical protein NX722_13470 [Endozoicomonas gorgoniicola]|uniref:Uncharacterized protein n=1 Tax=Endozoicomonas gorgoniicola TaxID=1234144 RepID=A0ABT3MW55_9GAMM|nr:hypothetical protein [Endozoicomonas gorgoniicola]MCW7553617.1 hypothetical protein [Endozoicomonas gorgoniicola]